MSVMKFLGATLQVKATEQHFFTILSFQQYSNTFRFKVYFVDEIHKCEHFSMDNVNTWINGFPIKPFSIWTNLNKGNKKTG